MFKKLSTKFILVFTGVLAIVFVLTIVIVRIGAMSYVQNYIEHNIQSIADGIDEGVTEVIDDAAYYYARLVKFENADLLDEMSVGHTLAARKSAFTSLVYLASVNTANFVDIGWYNGGEFFSVNGYTSPSDTIFAEAEKADNKLVLGEYKDGCNILVIHVSTDITVTKGCFVFYLMETVVSNVYKELGAGAKQAYIMGADGYIYSHSDKDMIGKTLMYEYIFSLETPDDYQTVTLEGHKYLLVVSGMDTLFERYGFDCYLINMLDYDFFYDSFDRLNLIFIIVIGSALIIGIALAVYRSRMITRPVEELNRAINDVIVTGKKSARTAKKGDEIYQLEKNYDKMMDSIFSLMQKNKDDMEVQRKLELDSLQMQINPHFLYNTLDAMVWMAKIKNESEIASLAINLAKFFRLSLHKGDKYILIWEEVELIKHYLEIDKIRFPDKVTVIFEVSEDIKNYKMLKLLIQPIVENTLKYAFPDQPGVMTIRAYGSGDDLLFEVEDNGVGFDATPDILEKQDDKKSPGSGYGLYNVNERIKLEYGSAYGLTVTSKKGKGTKTVVRIAKKI